MPWSQNGVWGIRHAGWPNVKLRLHDKGGTLSHKRGVEPEIAFSWQEVEGMERVKVFALPFLGEGARHPQGEIRGRPQALHLLLVEQRQDYGHTPVRRVRRREGR